MNEEETKAAVMELYIKFGDRGMDYSDVVSLIMNASTFDLVYPDLRAGLARFTPKALELIRS